MGKREFTEMMAVHFAAAELLRRDWKVGFPLSGATEGYDLIASKGKVTHHVEVKGLRTEGVPFWFNNDAWYDPEEHVEADVVIGVRALEGKPHEVYVGLAKEVQQDLSERENTEWSPWRAKDKYRNRWDKLFGESGQT